MGRRKSHNSSAQGRAEGRVRARVQQRTRGGAKRGGGDSGRKRTTLDLGAIEGHVNRLADRSGNNFSGLAGAASAFAGGSFASRLLEGGTSMSDEDFRSEVAEHFAILEERLQRLEEQVAGSSEQGEVEDLPEPEGAASPDSSL